MRRLLAASAKKNVFNKELLYNSRSFDTIVDGIINAVKDIHLIIPEHRYIDYKVITREEQLDWKISDRQKDPLSGFRTVNVDRTIYKTIELTFISKYMKQDFITKIYHEQNEPHKAYLNIPVNVDPYSFEINGNKHYPGFQIIDSGTFATKGNTINLRLDFNRLQLQRDEYSYHDIYGDEYISYTHTFKHYKNSINFLYYFLAQIGLMKTIKYMEGDGYSNTIIFTRDENDEYDAYPIEKYTTFKINNRLYMKVNRGALNASISFKNMVSNLHIVLDSCKRLTLDDIITDNNLPDNSPHIYWIKKLGAHFNKSPSMVLSKGEAELEKLINFVSSSVSRKLSKITTQGGNIFMLLKWMFNNFATMLNQDGNDLSHKTILMTDYIIQPFINVLSSKILKYQNKKGKKSTKQLLDIINWKPNIIINGLTKSPATKYDDSVNCCTMFSALKFTIHTSNNTSAKYLSPDQKAPHITHLSSISPNAFVDGDLGSGSLTPMAKIRDGQFVLPDDEQYPK